MGYYIFFDESGKIDRQKSTYSYYGALGIRKSDHEELNKELLSMTISREMHFQKFNLTNLDICLNVMNKLLEISKFNVYMVEREKALKIADRLSIEISKLRELLYIKIPERLIYGILRGLDDFHNIDIFIDECNEYDNYDIKSKLKYQLNAQSIYRDKKYMVNNVEQMDSKSDICLQGIDILIGMLSFIIDKKYISYREDLSPDEYKYIISIVEQNEKIILEEFFEVDTIIRYNVIKNNQGQIDDSLKDLYKRYDFYNGLEVKQELNKRKYTYALNKLNDNEADKRIFMENYQCVEEHIYKLKIKGNEVKLQQLHCIYDKYNYYTQSSIQKAEFVYRLISNEGNLEKFSKIGLFIWESQDENVSLRNTEQYINRFLLFKIKFDDYNKIKILRCYKEKVVTNMIEYEKLLGLSRNCSKMVKRYLDELDIKI